MEIVLLTIAHLAHTLATVIWIGGMFLFPLVIMPAAMKACEGPAAGKFMGEFGNKFKPWAYTCMVIFFITGILMMFMPEAYIQSGEVGGTIHWILRIKILLVVAMIIIGIYLGEVNGKRIGKLMASGEHGEELEKYKALQMKLAKVNGCFAFVVLLLTALREAMIG